ncbi:response regulator transcription factor [Lachnoanaerobaculum gingivalis]|uniref:response regulator transcription factor n=1 Tax=Lachnoanaerobaculum gingivalis TaxID=2490855 RepID=UPI0024A64EE1|nr:response regulator [Lachnoanaerobaculum gingivalis]WHE86947.1 response regulator [Lachnoanaerobaculum gingivalis]
MNLLIADDENLELKVLEKTIKKFFLNELDIFMASNGKQAALISTETEINIALLDIEMPGMNGIELAKLLREKNPYCIIIFITAYDRFDYAIEAMHIKAFDYLLKPWKEEKLTGLISEAIVNIKELSLENSANENLQESQKSAIKKYIKENYKRDISAGDVAGILGYSDVYFSKIFKQLFDDTFINYLTKVRIEKAKVLLKDVSFNIKEVGASVGYTDSNYFTKVFKRAVGMSPSEYRGNI